MDGKNHQEQQKEINDKRQDIIVNLIDP